MLLVSVIFTFIYFFLKKIFIPTGLFIAVNFRIKMSKNSKSHVPIINLCCHHNSVMINILKTEKSLSPRKLSQVKKINLKSAFELPIHLKTSSYFSTSVFLFYCDIYLIYRSRHKTLEFTLKNSNKVSTCVATIQDKK